MRAISPENQTALSGRALVARDFLWFVARNRTTGLQENVGFWSDVDNVSAFVLNPDTLTPVLRDYYGAGGLVSIDDIPSVSVIQVQDIHIRMSQIDELVEQAIRLYDLKQARVEVHRGLFDPLTRNLVAPAVVRFVGFVNLVEVHTPSENEDGFVDITCVSHTQELMRSNPATRSHADQQVRWPGDNFFADAAVVSEWEMDWGGSSASGGGRSMKGASQSNSGNSGDFWGKFL